MRKFPNQKVTDKMYCSFLDKTTDNDMVKAVKMGVTIGYCLIGKHLFVGDQLTGNE